MCADRKIKVSIHLVIPTPPFEKSIGTFRMTSQWSLIVSLDKEASCIYVQTNPAEVELSLFVSVKSRITQNKNMSNDHVGLSKRVSYCACVRKKGRKLHCGIVKERNLKTKRTLGSKKT